MPIDWKDLSQKSKHVPAFIRANGNFLPTLAYASLFHKLYPSLKKFNQPKAVVTIKLPKLDLGRDNVQFLGFGTSLCWWANGVNSRVAAETFSSLFFGLDLVDTQSEFGILPGLGMQVVRYNIGGCGRDSDPQNHPVYFPEMRRIEGFWVDSSNNDPETWDWNRDLNQRRILSLAFQKGAKTVEFFCNAPMYWMTEEKSSAGGKLLENHYNDFVHYAVSVLKKSEKDWGIKPHSLSLFNEPDAAWWFYNQTGQEGLNLKRKDQLKLLKLLDKELKNNGMETVIAASDENSVFNAIHSYKYLKKRKAPIGQYNLHGYFMLAPQQNIRARRRLRQYCTNLPIWVSEFGNWHDGIPLAMQIFKDLKYLNPTAWVYWQSIDHGGWGLLDVDFNGGCHLASVNKKYFVFAQFSRFIRAGDILVDIDSDFPCIAAVDNDNFEFKVVVINEDADRRIYLDTRNVGELNVEYEIVSTMVNGGPETNFIKSAGRIPTDGIIQLPAPSNSMYSLRFKMKQ